MDESNESSAARKSRKEEGRLQKRQRINESGGVRPRDSDTSVAMKSAPKKEINRKGPPRSKPFKPDKPSKAANLPHRFGAVMDQVPCRNKPRFSTLSMAVPGSVVSNCQTRELRTQMVGQIARAATIYHVDEIIVFDDKLAKDTKTKGFYRNRDRPDRAQATETATTEKKEEEKDADGNIRTDRPPANVERAPASDAHSFMARLLQYCECPQYLRRQFFPMHPDLQFAGLLAPIDAPHHVRVEDHSKFREGVVWEKAGRNGSLVNCGIKGRPVEINARLTPDIRCTVQIDPEAYKKPGQMKGTVVSPSAPREHDGTYWGYTTRLASSIKAALDECPYEGGYDLKIGTSERGDSDMEKKEFTLPSYKHALIVFGGPNGIEECVDADETLKLPGAQSKKLFDLWVNICPFQGSRTIRSEEAVLIGLAKFSPLLAASASRKSDVKKPEAAPPQVEFTDEEPSSEESSEESVASEEGEE